MASSSLTIPCPHCHTLNRVPAEKRGQGGQCGQCHKPLLPGRPIDLDSGPCRAVAPVFEAAAREFEPRLRLAKVDTDAEPNLAARYGVQAIPTMILIRGGREVARHSGAMPAGALRAWVEQHLRG